MTPLFSLFSGPWEKSWGQCETASAALVRHYGNQMWGMVTMVIFNPYSLNSCILAAHVALVAYTHKCVSGVSVVFECSKKQKGRFFDLNLQHATSATNPKYFGDMPFRIPKQGSLHAKAADKPRPTLKKTKPKTRPKRNWEITQSNLFNEKSKNIEIFLRVCDHRWTGADDERGRELSPSL